MSNNAVSAIFVICLTILGILFGGKPDIADALIAFIGG